MPPHFNLRRSTAHRVACIALYRALLSQCPRIYIPDERWRGPINPIKHLIRKRFQKQKYQQSQRIVVQSLKFGYQIEELLRTAGDGDREAMSKVLGAIQEHQERGDATRQLQAQYPPQPKSPRPPKPEPYPGAKKWFETRPRLLSELSGQRHIPKFQHTSGLIPLLLFKKPQSEFLSRIIRDRVQEHSKLNSVIEDFEFDYQYSMFEDQWDRMMKTPSQGGPWTLVQTTWKRDVHNKIFTMKQESMKMSKKMIDLMDQEQVLADQERIDRETERLKKSRAGQADKESGTVENIVNAEKPA